MHSFLQLHNIKSVPGATIRTFSLSPPLQHICVVEGMKVLLSRPLGNLLDRQIHAGAEIYIKQYTTTNLTDRGVGGAGVGSSRYFKVGDVFSVSNCLSMEYVIVKIRQYMTKKMHSKFLS